MLEKALRGSRRYYLWMGFLGLIILVGFIAYSRQLMGGLGLTGMSRDVSWGLYIAQFAFFVGVAASGVMVVIPHYLHDFKAFGKMVILGEFLAVASVLMAILFVLVDLGQPARVLNVLLYPSPQSIMFWDICVLSLYLILNMIIGWTVLSAEKKGFPPPRWTKVLAIISIPLAISIHTVTAFIFAGLPGKDYWLTALMAARFLASAFASGPALLILISLVLRRFTLFKVSNKSIDALSKIVCYALIANIFFFLLEVFTAFYSGIPGHQTSLIYLFFGLEGYDNLIPVMWSAAILAFLAVLLLVVPRFRQDPRILTIALIATFLACWLDKGISLVLAGFVPNSFERFTEYVPTLNEILIILGVYGVGLFVLTVLYKVTLAVRQNSMANIVDTTSKEER